MVKSLLLAALLPASAFAAKAASPRAAVPALPGGLVPFVAAPEHAPLPLIPYLTPAESLLPAPLLPAAAPAADSPALSAAAVFNHASGREVTPELRRALDAELGAEPAAR